VCVWQKIILLTYFTIQFIFATIHGSIALFGTIHEFCYTISANFYFYLQYFQQKILSFNKISRSQTNPKFAYLLGKHALGICYLFFFFCMDVSVNTGVPFWNYHYIYIQLENHNKLLRFFLKINPSLIFFLMWINP